MYGSYVKASRRRQIKQFVYDLSFCYHSVTVVCFLEAEKILNPMPAYLNSKMFQSPCFTVNEYA